MQDHHCLNKSHIYQICIDLSAMLLGTPWKDKKKKRHHIFRWAPVVLLFLSFYVPWRLVTPVLPFFPLSSLPFIPPSILLSVHLLDMPALFFCSLQPNFLTHFLFPPWPCDQSLQDGIAVGTEERERGMKRSMVKEYRKRGVGKGMHTRANREITRRAQRRPRWFLTPRAKKCFWLVKLLIGNWIHNIHTLNLTSGFLQPLSNKTLIVQV